MSCSVKPGLSSRLSARGCPGGSVCIFLLLSVFIGREDLDGPVVEDFAGLYVEFELHPRVVGIVKNDLIVVLPEHLAEDGDRLFGIIADVVGNEEYVAEHIVDLREKDLLIPGKIEIGVAQIENVGIAAESPAVEVTAQHGVVDGVADGRDLIVDVYLVVELAAEFKVLVAADAAGVEDGTRCKGSRA